jgi:hypothetical protein
MAVWMYRVARDDKTNTLHFVYARYRPEDMRQRCGMASPILDDSTIDGLRNIARQLLNACDQPIISMAEHKYEESEDYEDKECD